MSYGAGMRTHNSRDGRIYLLKHKSARGGGNNVSPPWANFADAVREISGSASTSAGKVSITGRDRARPQKSKKKFW